MSDLYGILSIAGKALMTQQQAISVTSHNIANVNTPGYSRQKGRWEVA
jgi:flagellar hook-associated protein 1 FlgK